MTHKINPNDYDAVLRARAGVTLETCVRRILRTFDAATPADVEAGATWYGGAGDLTRDLARTCGVSPDAVAAVLAQLSPRTTWSRNVAGAAALLTAHAGGSDPYDAARRVGCIAANVTRALVALGASDPVATINGPKTSAFAAAILGDRDRVVVDVWAARIALDPDWRRGSAHNAEVTLGRTGVYAAIAHAYTIAARRRGVDPTTCQATAWVVVRNGRAA